MAVHSKLPTTSVAQVAITPDSRISSSIGCDNVDIGRLDWDLLSLNVCEENRVDSFEEHAPDLSCIAESISVAG